MAGTKYGTHKHVTSRNVNPWHYTSVHVHEPECVTTFMLYNLSGQCVGYQEYRYKSHDKSSKVPREQARYYTYVMPGQTAMWGLECLNPKRKQLFVVEGTFKAGSLHKLGLNAVAILTSRPSQDCINTLRSLPYDLYAIGDNDPSGEALVKAIGRGVVAPKDLDEMTTSEVIQLTRNLRT